jgi:hypothetical protein
VPVPRRGLEAEVLLRREVALERTHEADGEEDRADEDVGAVNSPW